MELTDTSSAADLATLGDIALLLSGSTDADATLGRVTARLQSGTEAGSVTLWLREPNGTTFRSVSSPPADSSRHLVSLSQLPQPAPGTVRVDVVQAEEQLGLLELVPTDPASQSPAVLPVVAAMLAPYLAAIDLSADLASEVAVRTRQVEDQRKLIGLVIDSLPVGLYVVDRNYRIVLWNRKRETGTQGLRREDVMGQRVFDVLHRQPAEDLKAEFDAVFDSGKIREMEIEVTLDREPRFFRITKIPMRLDGATISHVITIGEDVTGWHGAQRRIMQSEKLAAIGQLAAGVMHEINNPLATIGACAAAMEGRLPEVTERVRPALAEYVDIIDKEVERCTRIVDRLLDFSRPKRATKRLVEVAGLVDETLFLLKHHRRFKRVRVVHDLEPDLRVVANAEQLIQVFMALMLNAADAMERDSNGTLTVRAWAEGAGPEASVVIDFADTGVGIPESQLAKIFEPFYTTKEHGRGTGLGLSICYGIVAEHGGRLDATSTPGYGSTFTISLPASPAEESA